MTPPAAHGKESHLEKVKVTVDTMPLPTAGLGFDNPNTLFGVTGGYLQDVTYPCVFHNHFLREELVTKSYERISFENEYLLVEFAPELGGRVWRIYDKIHGEDVVHLNDSIKTYPGGFGGAYTAGGIELDYPYSHAVTNTWPRKTEFVENEDGSATYTVSEWERNGRTEWAMSFTLSPGEARLKQRVTLYNRSKLPVSYMYWGNAGVPIQYETKWVYRETMGSEHGGDTIFSWPEYKGVDLSLYEQDHEVVGIYFLGPKYNFFGLTNRRTLSGLAHFADRHDLPGKKLWTWGRNASGENRSWHLSIEQQFYGEVQSGRPINQEHFEWLMPEEFIFWEEQWSPTHGLTDMTEVTEDSAFQILPDEKKIAFYPFVDFSGQKLQLILDGKILREVEFQGKAGKLEKIDISDVPSEGMARLEVKVLKDNEFAGSISLAERCERKSPKEIREEPIFNEHSSIANFVNAEFSQKLMYENKAIHYYKKAIELDDLNYLAHTGLGRMQFSQADFAGAKQSFLKAIDGYKWDPQPYMMLSHISQLEGKFDEALEYAFDARYYGAHCTANIKIAEAYIAKSEYTHAVKFLDEAKDNNKFSFRTYALLALCQRKLSNVDEASRRLEQTPAMPLKDLMWYTEKWFLGKMTDAELIKELFDDEWRFVELALNYQEIACYEEAEKLLTLAIGLRKNGWPMLNLYNPDRLWDMYRKRETPFLHILKGYIQEKLGRTADAAKSFKDGDYFENYSNTNAPELIPALEMAAERGNAQANHYLGNFLFHTLRFDDGLKYWQAADEKAPKNAINVRNLAVHARFTEENLEKARKLYREALELNPNNLYTRLELIETERACGTSAEDILRIFQGAPQKQQDTILFNPMLSTYMEANKWAEAAEYLSKVDRHTIDEDSGWYNFAISYADYLIDQGKPAEALEWIKKSRPTPANLAYIQYTDEYIPFHKQYYITGLAYKMLGNAEEARKYFLKATEQPTDYYYFRPIENGINLLRFYVALAMKELGMDAAARTILGGVNTYREWQALVLLNLDKSEVKRWAENDPNSLIVVHKHAGPEI